MCPESDHLVAPLHVYRCVSNGCVPRTHAHTHSRIHVHIYEYACAYFHVRWLMCPESVHLVATLHVYWCVSSGCVIDLKTHTHAHKYTYTYISICVCIFSCTMTSVPGVGPSDCPPTNVWVCQ